MTIAKIGTIPVAKKPLPGRPDTGCIPVRELMAIRSFAKLDRNQDKALSRDEYLQGVGPGLKERIGALKQFYRYDTNDDGQLSLLEYLVGRKKDTNPMHRFYGEA